MYNYYDFLIEYLIYNLVFVLDSFVFTIILKLSK